MKQPHAHVGRARGHFGCPYSFRPSWCRRQKLTPAGPSSKQGCVHVRRRSAVVLVSPFSPSARLYDGLRHGILAVKRVYGTRQNKSAGCHFNPSLNLLLAFLVGFFRQRGRYKDFARPCPYSARSPLPRGSRPASWLAQQPYTLPEGSVSTDGIETPDFRSKRFSSPRTASVTASERFQLRFSATASSLPTSANGTVTTIVIVAPSG